MPYFVADGGSPENAAKLPIRSALAGNPRSPWKDRIANGLRITANRAGKPQTRKLAVSPDFRFSICLRGRSLRMATEEICAGWTYRGGALTAPIGTEPVSLQVFAPLPLFPDSDAISG